MGYRRCRSRNLAKIQRIFGDAESDDAPESNVDKKRDENDDTALDEGIHERTVLASVVRVFKLVGRVMF